MLLADNVAAIWNAIYYELMYLHTYRCVCSVIFVNDCRIFYFCSNDVTFYSVWMLHFLLNYKYCENNNTNDYLNFGDLTIFVSVNV